MDGLLSVLLIVVKVDVDHTIVRAGRFESEVVDDTGARRGSVRRGKAAGEGRLWRSYLRKVLPAPAGEMSVGVDIFI